MNGSEGFHPPSQIAESWASLRPLGIVWDAPRIASPISLMAMGLVDPATQQTAFQTSEEAVNAGMHREKFRDRRQFIGGSDARIIMSGDEAALIRLWKEKRGEAEPEDFSNNLVVQLGVAAEPLNRSWYERNTGRAVTDVQRWVQHPVHRFLAATLDGFVNDPDAVFEAKFTLPWSFSEEAAAEKHMAQLQHNMWVTNARSAALSIITGGENGLK
jgi:predicted phage-related endonuclease